MSSKRDYYEVLGVSKDASESDLKNAFRRLARKYHPDRSQEPDADSKFKEAQEAYAVLSDSQKRAQYDRFGHDGPQGFGGFGGSGGFNINIEDLFGGDFFSSFFGGGGSSRSSRRSRGNDILMRHAVELSSLVEDNQIELEADLPTSCNSCEGTGAVNGEMITCSTCNGQGRVRKVVRTGPFQQQIITDCEDCSGRGKIPKSVCRDCGGTGKTIESTKIRFTIPAGSDTGTRLRMRSRGEPAPNGVGESGDLLIEVEVLEHPWFERNNTDLIMSLPVGYSDLVLGRTVTIEHIDGAPLDIKIPKNSNSGDTIEIKRRGLPSMRGKYRGDVIVLLKLFMPKKVNKLVKKQLEDMRESTSPDNFMEAIKQDAKLRRR